MMKSTKSLIDRIASGYETLVHDNEGAYDLEHIISMEMEYIWGQYVERCLEYIYGDTEKYNRINIQVFSMEKNTYIQRPSGRMALASPVDEYSNTMYSTNIAINSLLMKEALDSKNEVTLYGCVSSTQIDVIHAIINVVYQRIVNKLFDIVEDITDQILDTIIWSDKPTEYDNDTRFKCSIDDGWRYLNFKSPVWLLMDQFKYFNVNDEIISTLKDRTVIGIFMSNFALESAALHGKYDDSIIPLYSVLDGWKYPSTMNERAIYMTNLYEWFWKHMKEDLRLEFKDLDLKEIE